MGAAITPWRRRPEHGIEPYSRYRPDGLLERVQEYAMIVENAVQLTDVVVHEMRNTEDARLREILEAIVRHLHAFAREVRLTEQEFDTAIRLVTELGQKTTPSHNEVRLMAGSLGLSTLVCLMNNGEGGFDSEVDTSAN